MLRRADSTWRDKSWRRQALVHSKRKIPDSWRTGWKAKACTSFALYLKVFKNRLYYLQCCLSNHVYIHSFRSIKEATEKFLGGWGIWSLQWTSNGAFEQLFGFVRGEFEQKFSKNLNAWGLPRGRCLIFDLTSTLFLKRECRCLFHFPLCRCRNFAGASCRSLSFQLLHVAVWEPYHPSEFTLTGPREQANLQASKQIILQIFSWGYGLNIYLKL